MIGFQRVGMEPHEARDDGFVAITTALMMVALLMVVAFAVDIARWYMEAERVQRTVDAAALAGAPYLPEFPTEGKAAARKTINLNGFNESAIPDDKIRPVSGHPSQMYVEMASTIPNIFARVLGFNSQTVSRSAVADFAPEVAMGSPCNVMGNEPRDASGNRVASSLCQTNPNFWSVIALPDTEKQQGDQFASRKCDQLAADGCTNKKNDDYFGKSSPVVIKKPYYVYKIRTTKVVSTMDIQVYDPMFVNTGQACESTDLPANASGWTSKPNDYVTLADAKQRYLSGRTEFCTGDFAWDSASNETYFAVLEPTDTRDPFASTIRPTCYRHFGYHGGNNLTNVLKKSNGAYNDDVAKNFRQWVTVCSINSPQVNKDYYLLVRTNVSAESEMLNLNIDKGRGYAQNRFGIRVGTGSAAGNAGVSLSALERMPIFATLDGGPPTVFYLARVGSGNRGADLDITFFDTGDADKSGSIQVLQPTETNGVPGWSTISSCQARGNVRGSTTTPASLANCVLQPITKTAYQGKIQRLRIRVPETYSCTDNNPASCWYKLEFTYPANSNVTDTTTWSATLNGDPVRLVK